MFVHVAEMIMPSSLRPRYHTGRSSPLYRRHKPRINSPAADSACFSAVGSRFAGFRLLFALLALPIGTYRRGGLKRTSQAAIRRGFNARSLGFASIIEGICLNQRARRRCLKSPLFSDFPAIVYSSFAPPPKTIRFHLFIRVATASP